MQKVLLVNVTLNASFALFFLYWCVILWQKIKRKGRSADTEREREILEVGSEDPHPLQSRATLPEPLITPLATRMKLRRFAAAHSTFIKIQLVFCATVSWPFTCNTEFIVVSKIIIIRLYAYFIIKYNECDKGFGSHVHVKRGLAKSRRNTVSIWKTL